MPESVQSSEHNSHELEGDFEKALKVVKKYQREIIAVIAIILGIAVIYAYVRQSHDAAEKKAWDGIFTAVHKGAEDPTGKELLTQLDEAAKKNGSADAMFFVYLTKWKTMFENRDFEGAEKAAKKFLSRFPNHYFSAQARLGLGQALMQQDKSADAIKQFQLALKADNPALEPELRLSEAQAIELGGNLEKARDAYLNVARSGEQKGWPQAITETANFSFTLIDDKIRGVDNTPLTPAEAAKEEKKVNEAAKAVEKKVEEAKAEVKQEETKPEEKK